MIKAGTALAVGAVMSARPDLMATRTLLPPVRSLARNGEYAGP